MKKLIIAIIVIGLVAGAALVLFKKEAKAPESPTQTTAVDCDDQTAQSEVIITYTTSDKFSPDCVKIKSGTKITWQNDSSASLSLGADPHPDHSGNKEVSGGEYTMDIPAGGSATISMNKIGTFGYHNHNNTSATGTINVE